MKRRVVTLAVSVASLWLAPAFADDSPLPSLVQPAQIGRLMYFRGPRALTLYAPLALSSSLTCEPAATDANRVCQLRILNTVTADDQSQMATLQADNPRLQFSPIPSTSIEDVRENLQKMDPDISTAGVRPPGTLALSNDPYISIKISKSKKIVERLLAAYEKDGLGIFNAQFDFDGEHTDDYLELLDTSPVKSVLDDSRVGAKPSELRPRLEEALRQGGLTANHMTEIEAVGIAYRTVLANFFKLTRDSLVFPKSDSWDDMPDSLVLVNESHSPVRGRCQASLPLKHGAQATITCQEVEP